MGLIADTLTLKCKNDVYFPREDSFLLAEAVEKHTRGKVLDLGTGSGIQGIVAAKKGCDVTFSDIDTEAIKCAEENAKTNGVNGRFLKSDMFSNITGAFDAIIFNPPYLPSKPIQSMKENKIQRALDGGKEGRELIESFLEKYKGFLDKGGIALLLESGHNHYEKDIATKGAQLLFKKHYFFEDLVVLLLY
jgi:release factor glutamine methyltransferase